MIVCSRKTGCGYRKAKLFCTMACSQCCGQDRLNCPVFPEHEQEIQVGLNAAQPNDGSDDIGIYSIFFY